MTTDLAIEAKKHLAQSPYQQIRALHCRMEGSMLVVSGPLPSYLYWQLTTKALSPLNLDGASQIRCEFEIEGQADSD